jgi:threonine dehydrogenase-like Zn-dependent dehydrogenase
MIGSGDYPGGFAEYVAAPAEKLYPFDPEALSFVHAALADCVGVGLHAANVIGLEPGEATTIIGDGVIALFLLQVCVARGADPIVLIGKHERNLEYAREFGAALTLDAADEDLVSSVCAFSGPQDVVFEGAGGHNPPYEAALRMLRRGGRVGLLGLTGSTDIQVPWKDAVVFEQALVGMMGYSTFDEEDELRQTIDLMASGDVRIPPEMITRIGLDEIDRGFQMMLDRDRSGVIKVVIEATG